MAISITRAEIPDTALTDLETLATWALTTLGFMSNYGTYQEAEGLTVFRHDKSLFSSYLKETVMSHRSLFKYKDDYASGAYPTAWEKVDPVLDGDIPAEFLQ
ncbi:MAG: hypothetical protein AAF959_09870 [Cyanobacteria bacterium P01_D01_bin.56]